MHESDISPFFFSSFTILYSFQLVYVGSKRGGVGAEFASWLAEHEKSYSSIKELQKREKIFYDNIQHIYNLNQQYKAR